jgi:hypothetical protein
VKPRERCGDCAILETRVAELERRDEERERALGELREIVEAYAAKRAFEETVDDEEGGRR